jgi:hypothetical protein
MSAAGSLPRALRSEPECLESDARLGLFITFGPRCRSPRGHSTRPALYGNACRNNFPVCHRGGWGGASRRSTLARRRAATPQVCGVAVSAGAGRRARHAPPQPPGPRPGRDAISAHVAMGQSRGHEALPAPVAAKTWRLALAFVRDGPQPASRLL